MATKSERLADRAEKAKTKEIKKSSSKIKKQADKDIKSYNKAEKKDEAKVKRVQGREDKKTARAQKKVDREGTTRLDRKIARLEDRKKSKDTKKKTKTAEATAKDLDYTDKKATRKRSRDVASDNRKGRRKAGRDAKKQAMEDFSPATQKGHVVTKEEMKEGRKRAYLADQAAKAKKQKKADITEMDMDQAKMKAYKKANPDKYKDAANSPAKMYEGDMPSFDQMDSKNAMATAGEAPIKYFKQKINYDIKEASNSNLSQSARNHYAKNAQHDMKSMGKKYGSMAHMDGSMKGDSMAKKKGSVLSKHFRK